MKLELRNVAFAYEGNKPVFNKVSLSVSAGEILCLLGPNGSGKTTLFKTILGIFKPQEGDIIFNERNIVLLNRREIAHFMGYVPQTHVPPFPFSVIDVVLMGRTAYLRNYASPSKNDYKIARESLETLGILNLQKKNYLELSGGERQLVLIARALTQTPKFLVLDEPTSNLDFGNQIRVLNHIKNLANQGLGVIMSSHFPDDAFQYGDNVALMKDGQIYRYGKPLDVINEDNLKSIYGVDVCVAQAFANTGENFRVCIAMGA